MKNKQKNSSRSAVLRMVLLSFVVVASAYAVPINTEKHVRQSASEFQPAGTPPMPVSAVSRKIHGAAGDFDTPLPLSGTPGTEHRTGGATDDYTIVVTFDQPVSATSAELTLGTGCVGSMGVCDNAVSNSGNQVTIPLTNIANTQTINVTLHGSNFADVVIPMGVLVGDTNGNPIDAAVPPCGNCIVNSSDFLGVIAHVGETVNASNYCYDLNANGIINSTDVALSRIRSGTSCNPCVLISPRDNYQGVLLSGSMQVYIFPAGNGTFSFTVFVYFGSDPAQPYNSYGFSYWLETEDDFAPHLSITNVSNFVAPFNTPNQTSPNPAPFNLDCSGGATSGWMTEARDLGAITQPLVQVLNGTYYVEKITFNIATCGTGCVGNTYHLRRTTVQPRPSEVTDTNFYDHYMETCPPCSPVAGAGESEFTFTLLPAATATNAVSRKTHGGAGDFDINLPLTGTPGIECRTGGATNDFMILVGFSDNVVDNPTAQVTSGTGCVGSGGNCDPNGQITATGNTVMIPLTNVSDQQTINVTVTGGSLAPTVIPMSRLLGDTNANGNVNAADVSLTKNRTGPVDETNFRSDVNANGVINAADIALVKANTGHSLP